MWSWTVHKIMRDLSKICQPVFFYTTNIHEVVRPRYKAILSFQHTKVVSSQYWRFFVSTEYIWWAYDRHNPHISSRERSRSLASIGDVEISSEQRLTNVSWYLGYYSRSRYATISLWHSLHWAIFYSILPKYRSFQKGPLVERIGYLKLLILGDGRQKISEILRDWGFQCMIPSRLAVGRVLLTKLDRLHSCLDEIYISIKNFTTRMFVKG